MEVHEHFLCWFFTVFPISTQPESRPTNSRGSPKRKERKTSHDYTRSESQDEGEQVCSKNPASTGRRESTYSTRRTSRHIFDSSRTVNHIHPPPCRWNRSWFSREPTALTRDRNFWPPFLIAFVSQDSSSWRGKRTNGTKGLPLVLWNKVTDDGIERNCQSNDLNYVYIFATKLHWYICTGDLVDIDRLIIYVIAYSEMCHQMG